MRNILMVAFLSAVLSLAFITEAWAVDATLVTTYTELHVGQNTRYTYTVTDSVADGSSEVFKIATLKTDGKIEEMSFESASTDCDVWLSGEDGVDMLSTKTYIAWTGINLQYSPEMKERDYINLDDPIVKFLYFTIDNNDGNQTATGTWVLTIDWIRN